jgi:uncharacterized protein with GYD domain
MFQENKTSVRGEDISEYKLETGAKLIFDQLAELKKIVKLEFGSILSDLSTINADFEKMASEARRLFGGTEMFSSTLKNTMNEARTSVVALGGTMKDVEDLQFGIFENLNTQILLNEAEFGKLYSAANLVSKTGTNLGKEAGEIVTKFVDAGYSLNSVGNNMETILNTAREIGVSTVATYSQLSTNITTLSTFAFRDGVKGMAEMAANAALLRVDMSKVLTAAEKFLDPQKAIEAAGAFQRLGVTIPELLDPMKLGEMAFFEPEKLQQKLGDALAQFTKFNQETGKMDFTPQGLLTVREMSQTLGIAKEDLVKMGLNMGKIQRVMGETKLNPAFFGDEETKTLIAGMAQFQTSGEFKGQYTVNVERPEGKKEIPITELSIEDREILKKQTEPKDLIDLQKQANGDQKNMNNLLQSLDGTLKRYLVLQEDVQKGITGFVKVATKGIETIMSKTGFETKGGQLSSKGVQKTVDVIVKTAVEQGKNIKDMIAGGMSLDAVMKEAFKNTNIDISKNYNDIEKIVKDLFVDTKNYVKTATATATAVATQTNITSPTIQTVTPQPTTTTPNLQPTTPNIITTTNTSEQRMETRSTVEFGGTVNITVSPSEYKQSLLNALNSADVQNKLAQIIKQVRKEETTYQGRGEPNKSPSPNFIG